MRLNEAIVLFQKQVEVERTKITAKGYAGALMQFCRYMRNPLIMQITPEHVVEYLRESLNLGWKKNSLVGTSMALRKFFEYWNRKGYPVLNYQVLPIVQKEGVEPKVAAPDSIEKILRQCAGNSIYDVRNRAIVMLLLDTGARNGELCSMGMDITDKAEMQDGQYSYVVKTEKAARSSKPVRRIFWYQEANDALNRWLLLRAEFTRMFDVKDPEALFIGIKQSHKEIGRRMTPYSLGLMLRDISRKAGIPTVNAHSLRHLFGNSAAEQGLNNSNISDLMGHASLSSSFVYTHLKGKQLGEAHKKLKKRV